MIISIALILPMIVMFGKGDLFAGAQTPKTDVLYVRGKCIKYMHLTIYDRWGKLVFESEDQAKGWDGKYNGKNLDDAVFLFYLQVTYLNLEMEELKGNISLIR